VEAKQAILSHYRRSNPDADVESVKKSITKKVLRHYIGDKKEVQLRIRSGRLFLYIEKEEGAGARYVPLTMGIFKALIDKGIALHYSGLIATEKNQLMSVYWRALSERN